MKSKLLPLLLIVFTFAACRKDSGVNNEQIVTISARNCTNNIFGDASTFLCLDSLVQDSRCPANAMCIWEGVAQASFTFTNNNQQHHIVLSTNTLIHGSIKDTTINQYKIELINIYPYPGTGNASTIAEVRITR